MWPLFRERIYLVSFGKACCIGLVWFGLVWEFFWHSLVSSS